MREEEVRRSEEETEEERNEGVDGRGEEPKVLKPARM